MLRIYPVMLQWLEQVAPLIAQIARFDSDLAKQLRRSSASVILNTGEGMHSRGGHRTNAYGVALREMGESCSALQAAQLLGYIKAFEPGFDDQCRRILGTLVRLALPDRR
jgi:four helix bundle protein